MKNTSLYCCDQTKKSVISKQKIESNINILEETLENTGEFVLKKVKYYLLK